LRLKLEDSRRLGVVLVVEIHASELLRDHQVLLASLHGELSFLLCLSVDERIPLHLRHHQLLTKILLDIGCLRCTSLLLRREPADFVREIALLLLRERQLLACLSFIARHLLLELRLLRCERVDSVRELVSLRLRNRQLLEGLLLDVGQLPFELRLLCCERPDLVSKMVSLTLDLRQLLSVLLLDLRLLRCMLAELLFQLGLLLDCVAQLPACLL